MVTSIARQSVILKCLRRKSVLLGNYEFYYGAGLLTRLYGLPLNADMEPGAMYEAIMENKEALKGKDEKEEFLIKMVTEYEVWPDYDDQMKELFDWGASEEYLWQVNIP